MGGIAELIIYFVELAFLFLFTARAGNPHSVWVARRNRSKKIAGL
jgi:hypothetical protein